FCTATRSTWLERLQERDQIRFLLRRHIQVEALIVKFNRIHQGSCRSVMEVWGACCQCSQDRSFVFPTSAHLPVTIARPGSVVCTVLPVLLHLILSRPS